MQTLTFLDHVSAQDVPIAVPRRRALQWDDAEFHRAAFTDDPEGYALLALTPGVPQGQRARMLLHILAASQAGLSAEVRDTLARITRVLTLALPPERVITALLALRRLHRNHKHATRAVVRFVLEHPDADALIQARRPALADCFEHALGKATARGCAARIAAGDRGSAYLRRHLLRFLADPAVALPRVRALYAPGTYGIAAPERAPIVLDPPREQPPTVTATNRGDIAATLVHLYRGGPSGDLRAALDRYVAAVTERLPRLDASVTLVLDTSASMRGYGEREWALASQAEALRLVLARVCTRLTVVEVGGGTATDLATGLLDALGTGPDLVALVSDGYENTLPGDLARVVATLPHAGISTPIVFCHATFTGSDDLTLRSPAPALPQRVFWHQDDFAELLPWMFAHCGPGADWLRDVLRGRLDAIDTTIRKGGEAA